MDQRLSRSGPFPKFDLVDRLNGTGEVPAGCSGGSSISSGSLCAWPGSVSLSRGSGAASVCGRVSAVTGAGAAACVGGGGGGSCTGTGGWAVS